jgi:hypothetical protein
MGVAVPVLLWQVWDAGRTIPVAILATLWLLTAAYFVRDLVKQQRSPWSIRLALIWLAIYVACSMY